MSRIIIHKRKSGKYDYTITGDDVNQNIISHSVQGYGSKAATRDVVYALRDVLAGRAISTSIDWQYMTHAQYTEWLRKYRNQQRRNRRARKVKK